MSNLLQLFRNVSMPSKNARPGVWVISCMVMIIGERSINRKNNGNNKKDNQKIVIKLITIIGIIRII